MLSQRSRLVLCCQIHAVLALIVAFMCFAEMLKYAMRALMEQNPKWFWVLMSNVTFLAIFGGWSLAVGLSHWYASRCVQNLRYPLRTQLILATNLPTLLTMCLALTGLVVLVFGIVYVRHRHVRWAYAEVAKGRSVEEVLATTPPPYGDERDDYDDSVQN